MDNVVNKIVMQSITHNRVELSLHLASRGIGFINHFLHLLNEFINVLIVNPKPARGLKEGGGAGGGVIEGRGEVG